MLLLTECVWDSQNNACVGYSLTCHISGQNFFRILKCGRHVYLQWNRLIKGPAGIGGRRASSRVSNERPIYDGMFFSDG